MSHPFSGIIVRYVKPLPDNSREAPTPDLLNPNEAKKDQQAEGHKDQLHVNLWEMSKKSFLDIGIMINDPSVEAIQIDLPWHLEKKQVFDLGSRLVGEKIIAAIFNEVVCYKGCANDYVAKVKFNPDGTEEDKGFFLIRLNSHDFSTSIISLSDGRNTTQLVIRLHAVADNLPRYVRFRIADIPEGVYTSKFLQKDRNLLSSSSETRIVDFRINVRRGIPDDILSERRELKSKPIRLEFPKFNRIHLFLTVDRVREITFQGENFVACRSLEDEEIWNSYIQLDNHSNGKPTDSVHKYLGYQWTAKNKDNKPVKDLVALARFTQVTSSFWYMTRFLILALIVGAAGNGIWGSFPKEDKFSFDDLPDFFVAISTNKRLYVLLFLTVIIVFFSSQTLKKCWSQTKPKIKQKLQNIGDLFRRP